jgi:alpha-beta hydrolase superfamily lysophospholipase
MEQRVEFRSDGLRLSGVLHVPDDRKAAERRPAFMVLHGFGSNKDSGVPRTAAELFASLGYVALRFDMRGCGESEGARGRVICLEQVEDTRHALEFLQTRAEVMPDRIAVYGQSFGAAVAVYAAGVEPRIAACISTGGWGHGDKKFRKQHPGEAWGKFTAMMQRGREMKQRGETLMVPREDIVPIRPELRKHVAAGSIMEFPFEVVGRIAPRPLLLMHAAADTVTPTEQSVELFQHAGQPTDLHLVAGVDHFLMSENNALVMGIVRDWLAQRFPAR